MSDITRYLLQEEQRKNSDNVRSLDILRRAFKNVVDRYVAPEYFAVAMAEFERGCKGVPNDQDNAMWPNV